MLLYSVFKIQENLKVPEYLTREIINCGKQLDRILHSNLKSPIQNGFLPSVGARMDLEGAMLNGIMSDRKTDAI